MVHSSHHLLFCSCSTPSCTCLLYCYECLSAYSRLLDYYGEAGRKKWGHATNECCAAAVALLNVCNGSGEQCLSQGHGLNVAKDIPLFGLSTKGKTQKNKRGNSFGILATERHKKSTSLGLSLYRFSPIHIQFWEMWDFCFRNLKPCNGTSRHK